MTPESMNSTENISVTQQDQLNETEREGKGLGSMSEWDRKRERQEVRRREGEEILRREGEIEEGGRD